MKWSVASGIAACVLFVAVCLEQTLATVGAGLVGGITLIVCILKREEAFLRLNANKAILILGGVFLITAAASGFWAEAGMGAVLPRWGKLVGVGFCIALFLSVPISKSVARSVMVGLSMGVLLLTAFLIENRVLGGLSELLLPHGLVGDDAAFFKNNIDKAPLVILGLIGFPILLWLINKRESGACKWFARSIGGVALLGLLVGEYKTVLFAVGGGGIVALIGVIRPRLSVTLLSVSAAALLLMMPGVLAKSDLSPLLENTRTALSLQHRVLIADFSAQRIAERPLLGWGLDASRSIPKGSERIQDTPERHERARRDLIHPTVWDIAQNLPLHPHNLWLQVRMELGLPGALALLALLVSIYAKMASMPVRLACGTAFGTISVALLIGSISYGAWQSWWMSVLALVILIWRCASQSGNHDCAGRAGLQGPV